MFLLHRAARLARSPRSWAMLSILPPLGMLLVSSLLLVDLRLDALENAQTHASNLLRIIEADLARNIELYDLSLQAVVDNLKVPGVDAMPPEIRQLVLFDRAATAKDLGALVVADEAGDTILDASAWPPRQANYRDRFYFQAHRASTDLDLHISGPVTSRLTGAPILVLSRRYNKPDGSFGGVVIGTWRLSYIRKLFERLDLGDQSAVNLFLLDGTRIMRQPFADEDLGASLAGTAIFERLRREGSGDFVETSARDGVRRHYAFTKIGALPLILDVATAVDDIEADWRWKALAISLVVLALSALTIALSLLFGRELRRRIVAERDARQSNAELARLLRTDALTSLANRRCFDEVLTQEWRRAHREGTPLSLLVVDADHFKRYNDRYGHRVGDEVLQGLARRLETSLQRPADRVYRVGGEEFAILLPNTSESGALQVAEQVHMAVATLEIRSAEACAGSITVSIGLASMVPGAMQDREATDLFCLADEALYAAKGAGRNRTEVGAIEGQGPGPNSSDRSLARRSPMAA